MTDSLFKMSRSANQSVMEGQAAIELWLQGKSAWNRWATSHKGWYVNFEGFDFTSYLTAAHIRNPSVDFSGFIFPGPTIFHEAKFGDTPVRFVGAIFQNGYSDFTSCQFGNGEISFFKTDFGHGSLRFDNSIFGTGHVNFMSAIFGRNGETSFHSVTFNGPVSFHDAHFDSLNRVSFYGASFARSVAFSKVTSSNVIDLRGTRLMHSLNLDDCAIGLTRHRIGLFRRARNEDDVSCFRRLKQLAIESKDHLLEQDFFRKEQLAARFWETKGIALLPGFLYEWLSDFGRSILRPTVFLACVFLISACAYYWMANPQSRTSEAAIVFSAAQLFGISPWASEAKNFGLALLFGKLEFVPFGVQIIALTESILSVVSLFLIGLGLRNRFRL